MWVLKHSISTRTGQESSLTRKTEMASPSDQGDLSSFSANRLALADDRSTTLPSSSMRNIRNVVTVGWGGGGN